MVKKVNMVIEDVKNKIIEQIPEDKLWIEKICDFIRKQSKRAQTYLKSS